MRSIVADPVAQSYWEKTTYIPTGSTIEYLSGSFDYTPYSFIRSDVQRQSYNKGWRAPTAYTAEEITISPVRVRMNGWKASKRYEADEYILPSDWGLPSFPAIDNSLRSVLIYKALAKVKDEKINLAVTLAEIGDVVKMITKHAVKFRKAYDAAKRGDWKRAYDILGIGRSYKAGRRDLASGWLEMIYGWLPLISDVYGAVDEINRKVNNEGYTIVGRASNEQSQQVSAFRAHWYRWFLGCDIQTPAATRKVQKVSLWYRLDMPNLQRAAALGVLNPALLAWETTRLSFLFDWWLSIGDWLSSLDATIGLTFMGATHTYFAELSAASPVCTRTSPDITVSSWKYTGGNYNRKKMDRTVITDSPDDKLVATNPFSTSHAITAVALVITSLKR